MNINDYLFESCVKDDVEIASKEDAIDMLLELHEKAGNLNNKNDFKKAVLKRDGELSTALENGIAIPHAKSSAVNRAALARLRLKAPIIWDGRLVSEIYMLASPDDKAHINMLSALAQALQNDENNV